MTSKPTIRWEKRSLGDPEVAQIIMGQSPASSTYNQAANGLPFFQGKTDFGLKYPRVRIWCSAPTRTAKAGDILMSVRAPVGDVNIATQECCIGRGISAIRHGPKVDKEFLFYALVFHKPSIDALGCGAIFNSINKDVLLSYRINFPPLSEQRLIGEILSKIQAAAETQDKIVAKLKELKAATMTSIFHKGLRNEPLKETRIGKVPESWAVVPLKSEKVAKLLSGGTPSKNRADFWQGTIPWVSPKDMKLHRLRDAKDHISKEALDTGSRMVPAKSIFIVIRGMILAKDIPIALAEIPMAFNQDMKAVIPGNAAIPEFLLYALISRKTALAQEIGTSAHGTGRIGGSSLESLLIPLPPKNEQQKIARVLFAIEQRENQATKRCLDFRNLFSTTLEMLMTGQLRI